ncbi:bifunctional salicylyl-CoA 5-hydroxylase/oxidoreductase [Aquibaculum arenosum]|uniref:Bifunctional salicylyl-CoA 5-hydroxylase/oxidoreductase n=1 Tax=Aquibaculum arenosum TaxID=3032591 RepID=A0ABT5YPQ4_9PROT|nr:bifunctional salicylyl-CoA 5-hydroxylase/oxidoreductase [Fodinicurvata sp. CAU 1616]MDF2096869.1 bifunctional salicylyl-CoA 5-hydroxylase/oxidoreductase [Fodinicurvata sp. CAU 1616]
MRIAIVGGGPAGLYFAILMKKRHPAYEVTVHERNRAGDTFGWGVVFSDKTLENLEGADEPSQRRILDAFAHWDDIDIHFKGRLITSGGHGFCGIARQRLLAILQARAEELGVELRFETEIEGEVQAAFPDADLIVAADGINSRVRQAHEQHFRPDIELRKCKFVWLGTRKLFEAFTFIFEQTQWGWFQAHAYRFDREHSTFIVETREETWRAAGLDQADTAATIDFCERLFAPYLDGHGLMANSRHLRGSDWISFPRISNNTWVKDNIVLMGDAAHSAHFSIGSGTKLALEDAIALARHLDTGEGSLTDRLAAYEAERRVEVLRLQSAARNSTEWFENVARYASLEPEQFAYALLTRSQRVSHENLRLRDRGYLEGVERWFAGRAAAQVEDKRVSRQAAPEKETPAAIPPMFTPFRLRNMALPNRVVLSPMAMYSAKEGTPNDFHLVHLGSRALGGAGLIYTEMTCVSAEGRITPGCCGLYDPEHSRAYKRLVDFIHGHSPAKVCLQLGHAGPKGSTKVPWEGADLPLDEGNWPLLAPSPIPWSPANQTPREMTRADMDQVIADFVVAAERGLEAGFDMLELHAAHGYLLSSFITPLKNRRQDAYGGDLNARLRFPIEVFEAIRAVWPQERPMAVRVSASDWVEGGIGADEAVEIARAFKAAGADLIDVSAGQTSTEAKPIYGRMFQTPFSDRIRNEVDIATMAVGNIYETDHVNSILAAGRADLCALARPHLADPFWTLHAAAQLGHEGQQWPPQYETGRAQYLRNLQRAQEMAIAI